LLTLCAERFETRGNRAAAGSNASQVETATTSASGAETTASFLEDSWETCVEQKLAANSPEKTEDIVRHGFPMLVELVAPAAKPVRDEQLADVPLVFEGAGGRSGLSFCTQSNMNSRAAQLKRLKQQVSLQRLQRLVLVCDARVPLTPNARAARQYLGELEEQQAVVVFPAVEVLAALDALRELLSDAKSGDLAFHGDTVAPQTVREWLKGHLPAALFEFVDEILGTQMKGEREKTSDAHEIEALN
jgi:hypothetical protein